MARLGPRQRADFLALKAICYSGLSSEELLGRVGDRLAHAVGSDATCMVRLDPTTSLPLTVTSRGWPEENHRPLVERALLVSRAADPGRMLQEGRRVAVVEDVISIDGPYHEDPYFEFHLHLGGYQHEIQAVCARGGRARALLTLSRRATTGSFEPKHVRLLDAIAPHVANGVANATARELMMAPSSAEIGLIVLNDRGDIEFANAAGDRWLRAPRVQDHPGRIWVLRVLVGLLLRNLQDEGALTIPEIEVADPVTNVLHRLRAEWSTTPSGEPRIMVFLEPLRFVDRPEILMQFGLSRREAEVAAGLLRGATVQQLAQDTGLSPHTVAQHMRGIFTKLEVSSRRDLLLRLYGGF